jgi:hypothetical protein
MHRIELYDSDPYGRWHSSLDEKVELTKTWWKVDGHLATPAYGGNEPRFLIRVFQNPTTGEFLVWEVNLKVPMAAGVSVQPSQAFIRQLWDR